MVISERKVYSLNEISERFYSIITISADYVFEYVIDKGEFSLYKNSDDEFIGIIETNNDFEQFFKESGYIFADDIDTLERICDNIRSGVDRASFEIRLALSDKDEYQWFKVRMKTIRDDRHSPFRVIGKLENINDIKNTEKRLIDKAERDSLTKIYNKSTTKKLIKNYLRTDTRETYDAFIIIDVDDFKKVNDTLGHMFGDSILVDLSQEMQDLFRSNDVVGRIGGDEFIVFLRGMKQKSHIESKADDICKIFDLLYAGDDGTKITGSLGIALFPQDGDSFDELYRKADLALYASKRAGKSCYTFYNSGYEEENTVVSLPRVEQYRRNMDFLKSGTDFDLSILHSAFNYTGNGEEGVSDLLYRIGKHYNLSRVSVYKYFDDENIYRIVEQWNGKYVKSTLSEYFVPSDRAAQKSRFDFDDNDVFMVDFSKKDLNKHELFLKEHDVKACISCGYFKEGRLAGFVSFEECDSPRQWSIEEARSVIAAEKVIFLHYFRINKD